MDVGLLGDNLPLNLPQQLLCFGQCHTQVDNITETIRPANRHHVETLGLAIKPQPATYPTGPIPIVMTSRSLDGPALITFAL
jgi:hypothetical protein